MDTVVIKKSGKVLEALPHILLFFVNLQRLDLIWLPSHTSHTPKPLDVAVLKLMDTFTNIFNDFNKELEWNLQTKAPF